MQTTIITSTNVKAFDGELAGAALISLFEFVYTDIKRLALFVPSLAPHNYIKYFITDYLQIMSRRAILPEGLDSGKFRLDEIPLVK
jgi:hypothetical protein